VREAAWEEELTGEKWVEVDISDQRLYAYQGDTLVREFVISSGSARYPTVTGSFRTYARFEEVDMSGGSEAAGDYYFQADVPWVQYFYDGYALHGAYWHNQFGTPIGHGCINMRVDESQWLYEWTAVAGIRVEVHD
jgi:lipoprotein-anchoring transpeptidase ErfK/SrfK